MAYGATNENIDKNRDPSVIACMYCIDFKLDLLHYSNAALHNNVDDFTSSKYCTCITQDSSWLIRASDVYLVAEVLGFL